MRARGAVRTALAALALLAAVASARDVAAQCAAPPGDAFAFLSLAGARCPATPLVRWVPPEVVYDCSFLGDGTHDIGCGDQPSACVQQCRDAAATWNADLPDRFRFVQADATHPVAFCDSTDGRTSIGGSTTFCGGQGFGTNVVAVTLRVTITDGPQRGQQRDADVVVNQAFDSRFTPGLFRAVIEHELGHVLGLDHPDQCGRDANVLMRSAFRFPDGDPCFVGAPTADDVNGAMMIYAAAGPAPMPTPSPGFLCGDADGDGTVTLADATAVLAAAAGLRGACDAVAERCDVDATGDVDVIDAANVLRRAFGLPGEAMCQP